MTSSQKECESFKNKTRELDSYLSTLPTSDEINEAQKLIKEAKTENDFLKNQMCDYEKKLCKAKYFIKEKVKWMVKK